jgi:membrane protease subunit HflC
MQSYQTTFAKDQGSKTILLSPNNAYLNRFREP